MSGPPGTAPELHHLFDIATGWGVVAFLAISAGALLIIASSPVFPWYKRNLLQDRNYGRWIEYFFSRVTRTSQGPSIQASRSTAGN